MSDTNFDTDSALTAFQARKALLEVAQSEALKEEYSLVSEACTPEDLQYIIELAWRHQFDDDRSAFKRDIAQLQVQVSERAMDIS